MPTGQILTYDLLFDALLLAFGVVWCRAVYLRLGSDVAEFRASTEAVDRGVIAFYWALTLAVVVWMLRTVLCYV